VREAAFVREGRHVPRAVRRAVRQGSRLHAIVVEVVSQEKYAAWVADQNKKMAAAADDPNKQWTLPELVVRGEKVFSANCAACHQANGKGVAGAFPALAGSAFVNGPADAVVKTLLEGRKGTAMASFKQLSDTELAAVADYVRNSWGNSTPSPSSRAGQARANHRSGIAGETHERSPRPARTRPRPQPSPDGLMRWSPRPTTRTSDDVPVFSFMMFLVGGVMALTIRAELFQPGLQVVNPSSSTP